MRRIILAVAVLVVVLAGCGSSQGSVGPTTTVATTQLTIHAVAHPAGFCVNAPINSGTVLKVKSIDGTVLGAVTPAATPGTDSCDWTTTLTVPTAGFYDLESDGKQVITVDMSKVAGSTVQIVTLSDGSTFQQ